MSVMQKLVLTFFFAFLVFGMMFHSPIVFAQEENNSDIDTNDSVETDDSTETTDDETETEVEVEVETETEDEVEVEDVDEETEKEVEEMDITPGATLRILQLQRQLLIHILRAELVIDSLKELGKDTTELESIVAELEVLKEDAKIIPDDREEAIQKFIDIKKEAKNLIREFKQIVGELTTSDERDDIRTKFSSIRENAELTALNEEIENTRNELHKNRVENALGSMGVTDEELLAQIQSGEITIAELKEKLREYYDALPEGTKIEVRDELREIRIERKENRLRIVSETKDGIRERLELRLKERADKLDERGKKVAAERLRKVAEREGSNSGSDGDLDDETAETDNSGDENTETNNSGESE